MFLSKPKKATLRAYRNSNVYDDEFDEDGYDLQMTLQSALKDGDYTKQIKIIPYNADMAIRFGIVTIPEATGYFITNCKDAKEGDQVILDGHTFTIIKIADLWQFNKLVNLVLYVK